MLNYILRITWRTLRKNFLYTAIGVLGLSIGIVVFLGITSLIAFETSYNKDVPQADRIYRIYTEFSGSFSAKNHGISNGVPAFLTDNFTGIESSSHFHTWSSTVSIPQPSGADKDFERQSSLIFTQPSIVDLLQIWDWEAGSQAALGEPNKVVLLRTQAEKYFGHMSPADYLGRTVVYQDSLAMEVAGILSDPHGNTDFEFTDFLSSATISNSFLKNRYDYTNWDGTSSSDQFFIRLSESSDEGDLEYALAEAARENLRRNEGESWVTTYKFQPLEDLHFSQELRGFDGISHSVNPDLLRNLLIVAFAILLIAIINFVNLETALSGKRGKEIGIRKVMGSNRTNVIMQFLVQSIIMAIMAVILAVPLTLAGMELFRDYLPEGLDFKMFIADHLIFLVVFVLLVGSLAGIYPALILSSYKPVKVLKSSFPAQKMGRNVVRKGLIIFQFVFAQVLLIGTFIVFNQIQFMLNKDLGFQSENILYFASPSISNESRRDVLENKLNDISGIDAICRYQSHPLSTGWSSSIYTFKSKDGNEIQTEVFRKGGDSTYIEFFGIEQIGGRDIRTPKEVYINEAYMHALGFDDPRDVISMMIDPQQDSLVVAGVVKDFHSMTLHNEIKPLLIELQDGNYFGVKVQDNSDMDEVMNSVQTAYSEVFPDQPFSSQSYKNTIDSYYKSERKTSDLVLAASVIALFISCMGLFGMSSFMSFQRTKEIGIRKVQGATVKNIIRLLTSDFLKLVLVAVIVAIPFAYYMSNYWLMEFAYKAPFNIWILVLASMLALGVAFITVSYHAVTAARINPVKSLRTE